MTLSKSQEIPLRHALAGALILLGLIFQILRLTGLPVAFSLVSYTFWLAVGLLWCDLDQRNRRQAGSLAGVGFSLLLAAWLGYGADIAWASIFDGNTYVVAMLVGVSFISLLGSRQGRSASPGIAVTGRRGVTLTWLGVHLLGGILNLSSVFIVGDRLRRHGELNLPQLLAMNRGLSSAALWSPFFASMGVIVTLAPEMSFSTILAFGLPLTLLAGTLSLLDLSHRFDLSTVAGYSLSVRNLLLPMTMASLVMIFHFGLTPNLSIVSIITILLPVLALISNVFCGVRWTLRRIRSHALERLPSMRGEISLFLCAGLLTQGLSAFISATTSEGWQLFNHFGAPQAMISFLIIVASAIVGLHPIIGVSALASVLELEGSRQTLFAFVALGSWAVGTSVGPLSGINISLQGRYGISGSVMMRNNLGYTGGMCTLLLAAIWLIDNLLEV